ncbi:bis(5'-nucleosyl)-tetraphosphatase (symmetrical) YqeK [Clostridiisalibacter paucivorans]|uniref:bis(5'-nucleosyl)-tetraphosphatase (symmetrical) YqeK n=1 Tax=Clostridiisalibacter paucivorans TaxID=408753 RepID=UPI00055316F6|nr:bis(5'-nucleosyl)-tetraphosphatase (symmetrical) YqeK [Clostridiisalibacter paucivorans]
MCISNELIDKLIEDIGMARYEHSIRVKNMAERLSKVYGVDSSKAVIAGLLHDCGKFKDKTVLLNMLNKFDIILKNEYKDNLQLAHGILGAKLASEIYNIKDKEILNAIKYHTTGRKGMSALEKIIYIADYIEEGRDFPGLDTVRKLAFEDLDRSLIKALDNTIKHVINNGWILHTDTVEARNSLIY